MTVLVCRAFTFTLAHGAHGAHGAHARSRSFSLVLARSQRGNAIPGGRMTLPLVGAIY